MGRGLKRGQRGRTDRHCVDFNIDMKKNDHPNMTSSHYDRPTSEHGAARVAAASDL